MIPLGPSRLFSVQPSEGLLAGDISPAVEVPFHFGAGWLIALHHSILDQINDTIDYFYLSKIACEIHIGGEPYTEGSRGGAEFVILPDFHGFNSDRHYMMRRVKPSDVLKVRWKNIAEYSLVHDIKIHPSVCFWYLRDADVRGTDLSKLLDVMGVPWS